MWIAAAVIMGVIALALGLRSWRYLHAFGKEVQLERARELFKLQRERLEMQFMKAAAATGKPRGLRWKDCDWDNEVEFVRERRSGQIAALVGVTIQFEAIPGSDMEDLPAVDNLRIASAVFFFQAGHWLTVGKAIFNLSPHEAVVHFGNQYDLLG